MTTAYLEKLDGRERRQFRRQLQCMVEVISCDRERFIEKCHELSSAYPGRLLSVCDILHGVER